MCWKQNGMSSRWNSLLPCKHVCFFPHFSSFGLDGYIPFLLFLFNQAAFSVKETNDVESGERVHVIQLPPLLLQPVIYGRCETEQSSILDADCHQVP